MSNMQKIYDQFFDALEVIMNGDPGGGSWQERATRLAQEANDRSSQVTLQEFINWADVIEPTLDYEETTNDDEEDDEGIDDEEFEDDEDDDWEDDDDDDDDFDDDE